MRTLLVAGLGLILTATSASAQTGYGRYGRPNYGPGYRGNTLSPYLNLNRNNVGINYFLGTRTEEQRRRDRGEFRSEISDLATREASQVITTGTDPEPNTIQRYFDNRFGYFPAPGPGVRR